MLQIQVDLPSVFVETRIVSIVRISREELLIVFTTLVGFPGKGLLPFFF